MEIQRARYNQGRHRRAGRLKRVFIGLLALLCIGSGSGYTAVALTKPIPALAVEKTEISQAVQQSDLTINWPAVGQAAFGTLQDGVLARKGEERQQPMASITKIVTALAVLEKFPLETGQTGPSFTIGAADIDSYRSYISRYGAVLPVNVGQSITQLDALKGMLIPSGNNMADSLVTWTFGSMEAYLSYANTMLQRYGLTQTVVADASGFHPGSMSTPSDLIRLGQKALTSPVIAGIISQQSASIPISGTVNNTNALLADPNAVGIKTGNTDEAGSCLLFAYTFGPQNSQTFIGVIMGQPQYYGMFATARRLHESAMPGFRLVEVLPGGSRVGHITSPWGEATDIITSEPLEVFGWQDYTYDIDVSIKDTAAPVLLNQVVGEAAVGKVKVNLITRAALEAPTAFWRLRNYW